MPLQCWKYFLNQKQMKKKIKKEQKKKRKGPIMLYGYYPNTIRVEIWGEVSARSNMGTFRGACPFVFQPRAPPGVRPKRSRDYSHPMFPLFLKECFTVTSSNPKWRHVGYSKLQMADI